MISIPQSVVRRCYLKAYLASDHASPATGKTLTCVVSKNGAAFANPHAGATNATEIGSGWYYVDLDTTDTGTKGPLQVRATSSGVDDVEPETYEVASAHNAGFDGVPDVAAGASSGLPLSADASGRVDVLKVNGTSQTARDLGATLGAAGAGLTAIPTVARVTLVDTTTALTNAPSDSSGVTTLLARLTALRAGYLDNFSAGAVALEASLQGLITTIGAAAAGVATAVWGAATRVLTAGTNIVLAKGTGVTGLNDLDAAGVASAAQTGLTAQGYTTTRAGYIDTLNGLVTAIWAAGTRTLTSFGTLASDAATAVWGSTVRTLSAFGFHVQLGTTQDQYAPSKVGDAMTLTNAYDAAKTASQVVAIDIVSGGAITTSGGKVSEVAVLTGNTPQTADIADLVPARLLMTGGSVWALDSNGNPIAPASETEEIIAKLPSDAGSIPTASENADSLLRRNVAGGSDGGRMVKEALYVSRNKVSIDPTTGALTVYGIDDVTPAWTGTVTRVAADALAAVDPS